MTDPLTIVQLCAPDEVGGLERVVQALSVGLHRRGHKVTVAAVMEPGTREHPFLEPLVEASVPIRILEVPARGYLHERRLVAALYRELRPQVVHSHGYRPDVLDVGVARKAGIPAVTTLHGSSMMGGFSAFNEWLQLMVLRRFSAVVAVSGALREELIPWAGKGRVHLVRNAWTRSDVQLLDPRSARRELGVPEEGPLVGWVGRLIDVKRTDLFLSALSLMEDPRAHAVIVGDGLRKEALEEQARALGLSDRVTFTGSVFDVARLFPAFDLFVLSSRSEGTPVVLFEAMAAHVPIVATRVGGVPDMLPPDAGWLVEPGNAAALSTAMQEALADPAERSARAERGFQLLHSDFGVDPWISAHEKIYRQVSS